MFMSTCHYDNYMASLTICQEYDVLDVVEQKWKGEGKDMAVRKQDFDDYKDQAEHTSKRLRLTFDVTPELRQRIKIAAVNRNLSISEYLAGILNEVVPDEATLAKQRRPASRKMLNELLQLQEQILQERNGQPFEDSVEMIRQMREERSKYLEEL